ncbi:MazG nucleotide pyrophosphohydrolase domain-containing protein [Zhihengliuella salsuginis]|uniref:NTP pyrophosphohydrolase MazG-like domain-containing protein n=1 Tax=Zhihengliuella salsuginis TaxID=578222 RepID=A0ABQ3GJK2_9MICC|nr:MazG nucleotide pyrophosphohydrolase domain-containing protein [Zhihengliuella salsuginis]GHD09509.1 hypothetical protein GCM10008096_22240 [Zhihengliuella salsuginis]
MPNQDPDLSARASRVAADRTPDALDARRAAAATRLLRVVDALRTHCAWTRRLTHGALVEYLVEESYELVEAIEDGEPADEVRGELADVLLQVVLHSAIAEEDGAFDFADVADFLSEKMIRRNKHVFAADGSLLGEYPESIEEIIASWDQAKRAERPRQRDPFASLPRHLPALTLADKTLGRAERWDAPAAVVPRVDHGESAGGPPGSVTPATEAELGGELLRIVDLARRNGWDAERALRGAVARFTEDVTRALG